MRSVGAAVLGGVLGTFASPRDAEAAVLKTLWAVVDADGTLQRGKGVTSLSRLSSGEYLIKFKQDVSRCACSATLLNNSGFVFLDTIVTVDNQVRQTTPREVGVTTLDRAGFVRDTAFHLVVHC